MERLTSIVESAQAELKEKVMALLDQQGRFEIEQYARFLTMQFYLTDDVQQEFYTMAGNHSLARRKALRKFMVKFAEEEEPHYLIAEKDLEKLGLKPGDKPLDVHLWKTYFNQQLTSRPFRRYGATCVLENIADTASEQILKLIEATPELDQSNTRFLRIHMHGDVLPHGKEVFQALEAIDLSEQEMEDLEFGARVGKKVYLQLVDWIITGKE